MKNDKPFIAAFCAIVLTACGGGSGSVDNQAPITETKKIVGTVAIGAAMANLPVDIKDSNGNSPCVELFITTDATGNYQCTLKTPTPTAPYFLHVNDLTGTTTDLYSVVTTSPISSTTTVNVTPITTAIIAQAHNTFASVIHSDPSKFIKQNLDAVKTNLLAQIGQVTSALGLSNYDPFSTTIIAANSFQTGNNADQILDLLKISKNGKQDYVLNSVGNVNAISLASKSGAGDSVLAPTLDNLTALSLFLKNSAAKFRACAALPSNQRIKRNGQGVFESIDSVCLSMVSIADPVTGVPSFKHHAQPMDWFFWALIGDGANKNVWSEGIFMPPEIMELCKANTKCNRDSTFDVRYPRDRAWINIKIIDKEQGSPLNFITVAQNYGTNVDPNWQITGDQSDMDHSMAAGLWRVEDWTPSHMPTGTTSPEVIYKATISPRINKNMPNGDLFDAVKVEGPGLPTTGLWYFKKTNSSLFVMIKERLVFPSASGYIDGTNAAVTGTPVCSGCNSYIMEKISMQTVPPQRIPPGINQSNRLQYALGTEDGSYNGLDDSIRPKSGDFYKFSSYNAGVMYRTEYERLSSDVVDPMTGARVLWMIPGSDIIAALNPENTSLNPTNAISNLNLNWNLPMPGASVEPIKNVWVSQSDGGYENATKLNIGTREVNATPLSGQTFNSIGLGGIRDIGLDYRMMDGSTKISNYFYDSTW